MLYDSSNMIGMIYDYYTSSLCIFCHGIVVKHASFSSLVIYGGERP